ncbi:MAG: hypothetical protein IJW64_00535 [Clostridia bacterium]|nr:hypothetical protein [Clostridia bacterium]
MAYYHTPIQCENCSSKNIAIISEFHKEWGLRILNSFIKGILFIISFLTIYDAIENKKLGPGIVVIAILGLLIFMINAYIVASESKSHVQIVCKDCGHVWLHK